jgi:hypothetical protein
MVYDNWLGDSQDLRNGMLNNKSGLLPGKTRFQLVYKKDWKREGAEEDKEPYSNYNERGSVTSKG